MDYDLVIMKSVDRMLCTSGRTVLFSAVLLVTSLCGALQFNEFYLTTMALTMIFIAIFSSFGALTFVPAYYMILGKNIFSLSTDPITAKFSLCFKAIYSFCCCAMQSDKKYALLNNQIENENIDQSVIFFSNDTTTKNEKKSESNNSTTTAQFVTEDDLNDFWFRVISYIVQYPYPFLIGILSCLILLTTYFIFRVRLATFSWSVLPVDSPIRYTYETTTYDFVSSGKTSMDVFLQTRSGIIGNTNFIVAIDAFCSELESYDYVVNVQSMVRISDSLQLNDYIAIYSDPYNPLFYNVTQSVLSPFYYSDLIDVARVTVDISVSVSDRKLGHCVRQVRNLLKNSFQVNGESMLIQSGVTGDAATQYDTLDDVSGKLPTFLAVIIIAMSIFILLLTGSLFLPIKTIVTSGLSISASFALLVLIFQDGYGSDFLNFENNFDCLDELQLLFIFVVAFGLSLDYEVFILGRIQEIYERTGNNNYAISKGVSSSARTVSIAALLVCIAIGGLLFSDVIVLKMIGIGIGLTVVLDATIIRCVLIPAVMSIMGTYTWYAPQSVKKVVEYFGIQEKE